MRNFFNFDTGCNDNKNKIHFSYNFLNDYLLLKVYTFFPVNQLQSTDEEGKALETIASL